MKHRAFAQTCRSCRKSRPLADFKRPGSHKVNKSCLECIDARREGHEPDVAPAGLAIYLPIIVTPEQRQVRRWWPSWVHADDPKVRLNPRGAGELRSCTQCDTQYESKHLRQRYCSKRCKSAHSHARERAKRKTLLDTQAKA
jgi:hypothetical protein